AYESALDEARAADLAIVLRLATAAARQGKSRFAGLPLLLIDPPADSAAARELLTAFVAHSPRVLAITLAGDELQTAFLRGLLGAEPVESTAAAATTLDRTRIFLFAAQAPESPAWDDSLDYFSAPGEGAECVEICRRIRRAGVSFDRIAILLRDPDRYHPFIE